MPVSNTEAIFNGLYGLFTILGFIVAIIFFAVMGYFLIKYRERKSSNDPGDTPRLDRVPAHRGHLRTVAILLFVSSILLAFLIAPSLTQIDTLLNPPAPSCTGCDITVIGHQFYWEFGYNANGSIRHSGRDILRIPLNQNVTLHVKSADVFHDFGIVEFRIKTDAIPGRTNVIWFNANQLGNFTIRCFELCGTSGNFGHSTMKATLIVMPQSSFQQWYASP